MRINQRHITLATRLIAGDTHEVAGKFAKYKGNNIGITVAKCLRDKDFKDLMDNLRAAAAEKNPELTVEWITNELIASHGRCKSYGDEKAAQNALSLLGKTKGMFVTVTRDERPRDVQFFRDISGAGNFKQVEPKEKTNDKQDNNAGIAEHSGPAGPRGPTVYQ